MSPVILVVAAHPDDEVLGCGGTIARFGREENVHVLILGEGISSRYTRRKKALRKQLNRLKKDAHAAAALLGVRSVEIDELPDNRFDSIPLLEVVRLVEVCVERLKPRVVYTHHMGDLNIDHWVTARAVLTATRPLQGCPVEELYAFEVPSSTEWGFQAIEPAFRPTTFVDITESMETKIEAMEAYTSERRPFPHPRSPESLRAIARRWGSVIGTEYAEAFELLRMVR